MRIVDRMTNLELVFDNDMAIIKNLYSPMYAAWLSVSDIMRMTKKKYEDVDLVPYVLTESDKRRLKRDPAAIQDIPRYYMPGYDAEVSSDNFERRLKQEFLTRYHADDQKIISLIHVYHPVYTAYSGNPVSPVPHKQIAKARKLKKKLVDNRKKRYL